jgi:hypothetical protein
VDSHDFERDSQLGGRYCRRISRAVLGPSEQDFSGANGIVAQEAGVVSIPDDALAREMEGPAKHEEVTKIKEHLRRLMDTLHEEKAVAAA